MGDSAICSQAKLTMTWKECEGLTLWCETWTQIRVLTDYVELIWLGFAVNIHQTELTVEINC